jgi:TolB-like protein
MHARGIVHRDLKPANIFLTPHGVKVLDFGVARTRWGPAAGEATIPDLLTAPGTIVGTPQYMPPEALLGREVDARGDLFASGVVLFEMLTGSPPWTGDSPPEIVQAVVHERPPVLSGSPTVAAVDRVIHRALAKGPKERYPTAEAMAQDLRAALLLSDTGEAPRARPMTRLIVLPFRMLRPDADADFLAFSLADAVTASLSGVDSLVVRSTLTASRVADAADLKAIAAEADVDVVLAGTLLRSGDQLRVSTQLVEAPAGTVLWSHTAQVAWGDIFALQDDLAHRIVTSLSLPLTGREQRLLRQDVPANARAYEYYLRANQIASDAQQWSTARDLYLQCLAEDARYAPAWARLGRIYRVLAKFDRDRSPQNLARAEEALNRALELNPDLAIAHHHYAQLEIDLGRARDAMVRLVEHARKRTSDPELFAGLVHACRYCGLLDASVAAFERARRLDPAVVTSVTHTLFALGRYDEAAASSTGSEVYVNNLALAAAGRWNEALEKIRVLEPKAPPRLRAFLVGCRTLLEGQREESIAAMKSIVTPDFTDPEGQYYVARHLAHVGNVEDALALLGRVVEGGYFCYPGMLRDSWLDPLRGLDVFKQTMRRAEERYREALAAFAAAGGNDVLGVPAA